jgi:hypothetical protein
MKEQPISVHVRAKLIFRDAKNESSPQCTDIECSLFKPPHHLQACTEENVPNMEGVDVCKTSNFSSESQVELEDSFIVII